MHVHTPVSRLEAPMQATVKRSGDRYPGEPKRDRSRREFPRRDTKEMDHKPTRTSQLPNRESQGRKGPVNITNKSAVDRNKLFIL